MILIRYDIDIIHLKLSHLNCGIRSRRRILHMNSPFVHTITKVRGWDYVQFTTWRWWPRGELRTIGEKRYDGNDDPIIIFLLTSSSCGPRRRSVPDWIPNSWFTMMTELRGGRRILVKPRRAAVS